jgi:hypothetical protein
MPVVMTASHPHAMARQVVSGQDPLRRTGRTLLRVAAASLVVVAAGPVAVAAAESPIIVITSPLNGSSTNNQTPVFSGNTNDFEEPLPSEVKLTIYKGATPGGTVQETRKSSFATGAWSLAPLKPLTPGIYTAVAEQENGLEPATSNAVTFTVDTTPPLVTLSSPVAGSSTSSGSVAVSGSAGTASGDLPTVMVHLSVGEAIGASLETLVVQASNGSWSTTVGGLNPGTYTVQAEQRDEAGNIGLSAQATFTVNPPAVVLPTTPSPPPAASFKWFPSVPHTGEPVALVSTSTDASSPITGFAWDLTSTGAFSAGKPVLSTSFSTPGAHVVRLRVTDADGLSSVAVETIQVAGAPLILMQPFPIVRIAGTETSSGVNLSLLTVQAPVAARVTVTCRGRGCKRKSESLLARSSRSNSKASSVLLAFRRFQRSLPAGVVLEIRVTKPGEIGKYTRFAIRRQQLPVRTDACLGPTDPRPISCPS